MAFEHPSPAASSFLDPASRRKELGMRLKQIEEAQHEATEVDPSYNLEDEAKRLFNEVESAMEIVRDSDFYCKLVEQLDSSVFQEQLKICLGSNSTLKMVIYALGCMEFFYHRIFQLAISLLLKERCFWIEEIEVYNPDILQADIIVLKKAGCNVLTINENRTRTSIDKPTLFFITQVHGHFLDNLYEANWSPSQMNHLLLLKHSGIRCRLPDRSIDDEYGNVMDKYSIKIPLPNYGYHGILNGYAWHFFKVDSHLDMDTLKPDTLTTMPEGMENRQFSKEETFTYMQCVLEKMFLKPYDENTSDDEKESADDNNTNEEKEGPDDENTNDDEESWDEENINDEKVDWRFLTEYRGPRVFRCNWHTPPKGWIKLNIASSRRGREELGESLMTGYGGICYNENKERVLDYKGKIEKVDQFAACVEALKIGLEDILKKIGQPKPKLIVETDNFKLVHWVNWDWSPLRSLPAFQVEEFLQVQDLIKQYDCYVIYHVYEEANHEAICLAKQETS